MTKIQITQNFKDIEIDTAKLKKLTKYICDNFAKHKIQTIKYEISIVIIDNVEIRKINKKFLNHNCFTDCISFDLSDSIQNPKNENQRTFELVVNGEMAVKQAKKRDHSSQAELALYITHSLLHNFGFDDSSQQLAEKMHKTEDEILTKFGFGSVYN
ncbi:MAG: rRNA maturation RNase YbeY [Planctomycetes bacterium]|nr:rRNA maturation RNase YbeY [Planctomycetota bacterium]MCK5473130.1 rRNA maturation RNase YbeY [Planctomycetota bacterium]